MLYDRTTKHRLTHEQRTLAEQNLGLVGWFLGQHSGYIKTLGYDDAFQIGCLGLMKAARNFNPDRGKFATIAVLEIHHALAYVKRQEGASKRSPPGGPVVSLNTRIQRGECELQDTIAEPGSDPEARLVERETMETASAILRSDDILRGYFAEGKCQTELAKECGRTQSHISREITKRVRSARRRIDTK